MYRRNLFNSQNPKEDFREIQSNSNKMFLDTEQSKRKDKERHDNSIRKEPFYGLTNPYCLTLVILGYTPLVG